MSITELKKKLSRASTDSEKVAIQSEISSLVAQAESHIRQSGREISYTTREWSVGMILEKFNDGLLEDENELFIPDYQRDYKWEVKEYSRFIESILLDFPIPYLYIADVDSPDDPELDGRVEIIDGSQRIRALNQFVNDNVPLGDLKEIHELDGFTFSDLSASRRRRFLRETLRLVELKGGVDEDTRRDLFERINSGSKQLEAMEVRHGSQYATTRFYREVLTPCSESALFESLAPLSDKKKSSGDHRELVLRYFSYLNYLESYNGTVKPFLDEALSKFGKIADDNELKSFIDEFNRTMDFIQKHIPMGFRKTESSNTTTRARYEALAVGTAYALRENAALEPAAEISSWITSDDFQKIVGADSANNTSQLFNRINYVKDKLLVG